MTVQTHARVKMYGQPTITKHMDSFWILNIFLSITGRVQATQSAAWLSPWMLLSVYAIKRKQPIHFQTLNFQEGWLSLIVVQIFSKANQRQWNWIHSSAASVALRSIHGDNQAALCVAWTLPVLDKNIFNIQKLSVCLVPRCPVSRFQPPPSHQITFKLTWHNWSWLWTYDTCSYAALHNALGRYYISQIFDDFDLWRHVVSYLLKYLYANNYFIISRFDKVIAKRKRCIFDI